MADASCLGVGKVQVAVDGVEVVDVPPLFEGRAVVRDLVPPAPEAAAQVEIILVAVDHVVTLEKSEKT